MKGDRRFIITMRDIMTHCHTFQIAGEEAKAGFKESIDKVDTKIAAKIGTPAKGIEIVDLAVHPVSHIGYIAVRKLGQKPEERKSLIFTIDGEGKIDEFLLEKVK